MAERDEKMEETPVHDGISPIYVPDVEDEDEAFQMLWEYLSRPKGRRGRRRGS